MTVHFARHATAEIDLCVGDEICSPRIISEIESGRYEEREMLFSRRVITPKDRVLELGAGLGFVSTMICKHVKPAFFAAVEADARLIPYIEKTHAKNGIRDVELINAVMTTDRQSLERGYVEFGVTKAFWGSGIDKAGDDNVTTTRVPTLDASAYIRDQRITALVSDIEGGELDLLRNLDFSGLQKIILEIHPNGYRQAGNQEIFRILDRQGFVYNAPNSSGPVLSFEKLGVGNFS